MNLSLLTILHPLIPYWNNELSFFRHSYDCHLSVLDISLTHGNYGNGVTVLIILALKLLTTKPAQFFIDNCIDFNEVNPKRPPVTKQDFVGLDMVYHAVTHLDTMKDQFQKILYALFMYQELSLSNYFDEIKTAGKCIKRLLRCKGHNIYVTDIDEKNHFIFRSYIF